MSTTMFLSVLMAIIMAVTNNNCALQKKQETVIPEEAIVCEAEAELDGGVIRNNWVCLEEIQKHEMLQSIGMEKDGTVVATIDATVISAVDEHPIDCFTYVEALLEDPEGDWFIEEETYDELGQPVWSVTNAKGWKVKLVFTDLETD